ncbi:MAG: hypothetical protein IFK94_09350 [Acidobacteria bacterium]|uniref:Uncharacterized protein n=1 Tax=Candidatus Polarisedimenticola svalbardensis TaxID=2886004 RepID=A0A8J6Y0Y2_9BACT|nr:hypothetical protein [Candidatus Polarisedimenticola svalbardensis]
MRLRLPVILGLAALLAAPAAAGEIIHFTSGTTLEIQGHIVEDGMIHVDLGGGSGIAFPVSMVDNITRSGSSVFNPNVQRGRQANVASSGGSGGVYIASSGSSNTGRGSGASAASAALEKLNAMENGSDRGVGQGVVYPLANHPNRAARQIGVQADMRIYGQSAAQRQRTGNNDSMRNANTVATANGTRIIGGEPPNGKTVHLGVEVFSMGESNRLQQAKVAAGTAGDSRYIPGAVKDD